MNTPDPRNSPPPLTGLRPRFVRDDEWLTYAFGYDDRETDDWIVPRNASDMTQKPLWIGSSCRSLFVEEEKVFKRDFSHDRRYAESKATGPYARRIPRPYPRPYQGTGTCTSTTRGAISPERDTSIRTSTADSA